MKTFIVILKPFRLDAVLEAVAPLTPRKINYLEVRGYGRQKGHLDAYEGSDVAIEFIPKIRLEMEIDDRLADEAKRLIGDAARTGRIGDGKIFILDHMNIEEPSETVPGS